MCGCCWERPETAAVLATADRGRSWSRIGGVAEPRLAERLPDMRTLLPRRDRSLWRVAGGEAGLVEYTSRDGGRSWRQEREPRLRHGRTGFHLSRLPRSSRLLWIRHGDLAECTDEAARLTAFLSGDDGASWSGGLLVDERLDVSGPDAVQSADGMLYVVYDFSRWGQQQVLLAMLQERDIEAGRLVSRESRLRIPVCASRRAETARYQPFR
jgi:hypothetical protein